MEKNDHSEKPPDEVMEAIADLISGVCEMGKPQALILAEEIAERLLSWRERR
jgi:hypothetical protein